MKGRLFYLMGASGAGKDTLLDAIRQPLESHPGCRIARRYITRPAQRGGENHIPLSEAEFIRHQHQGAFSLQWDANGHRYAIGSEVEGWLERGTDVLINGSRAYLEQACQRFPQLIPILVEVDPQLLRHRLVARGREHPSEIEARLLRAQRLARDLPASCYRIDNSSDPQQAADKLLSLVTSPRPGFLDALPSPAVTEQEPALTL